MHVCRIICAAGLILSVAQAPPVMGSQLESIERKIAKEPVYSGEPQYALAVFGSNLETRMWLVWDRSSPETADSDVLYIDLDGDGDLTDPDERITAQPNGSATRLFSLPFLVDPNNGDKHTEFSLKISGGTKRTHMLSLRWRGKHKLGGGYPVDPKDGYMQFGTSSEKAPVVWFNGDGPFTFQPWYNDPMEIGKDTDLKVFLGQVGSGANSFCAFQEHVLPDDEVVVATLFYTDNEGKEQEASNILDQRC